MSLFAQVVRTYELGDVLYAVPAKDGEDAANWYMVIDPAVVPGPAVIGYVTKTSIIPAPRARGTGMSLSRQADCPQPFGGGRG